MKYISNSTLTSLLSHLTGVKDIITLYKQSSEYLDKKNLARKSADFIEHSSNYILKWLIKDVGVEIARIESPYSWIFKDSAYDIHTQNSGYNAEDIKKTLLNLEGDADFLIKHSNYRHIFSDMKILVLEIRELFRDYCVDKKDIISDCGCSYRNLMLFMDSLTFHEDL